MIALFTPIYDLEGALVIMDYDPGTDIISRTRRVSRIATLDGGCSIEDNGLSHSDRVFKVSSSSLSDDKIGILAQMIELYPSICITTSEGIFKGVIDFLNQNNNIITFNFLVKEKVI